jgi:hypothetical protein
LDKSVTRKSRKSVIPDIVKLEKFFVNFRLSECIPEGKNFCDANNKLSLLLARNLRIVSSMRATFDSTRDYGSIASMNALWQKGGKKKNNRK